VLPCNALVNDGVLSVRISCPAILCRLAHTLAGGSTHHVLYIPTPVAPNTGLRSPTARAAGRAQAPGCNSPAQLTGRQAN
jgi:hypothetical protein